MSPTLQEAIGQFLARYDNAETLRGHGATLQAFARQVGPERALGSLTPEDVDRWYAALRARKLAAATLANRGKIIKAFCNWCVQREYLGKSPARLLTLKKRSAAMITKAIPGDVLGAMLEQVNHKRSGFVAARDSAILALMATFGARAGDVARLPAANVNLAEAWIVLRVKGGKEIRLPLPGETAAVLARWLDIRQALRPDPPHELLFTTVRTAPGRRYGPLVSGSISTLVKRLSASVGGKAYGPHSIRHWRGQSLADQHVPATIIRDILGHSDVKITLDHYFNQDDERVRAVLERTELGKSLEPGGRS